MTMKIVSIARRVCAFILVLALVSAMNLFAGAVALAEQTGFTTTFQINLRRNVRIAKYGVTVYLDDTIVEYIRQGDMLTFNALLTDGMHELTFVPGSAKAETRVWTLGYLEEGSVVTCNLQTHRKYIEIRECAITDGEGNSVSFAQNRNAEVADRAIELAGKAAVLFIKIQAAL